MNLSREVTSLHDVFYINNRMTTLNAESSARHFYMTDHHRSVQVDESGAGSAGISQYINQVARRLENEFSLTYTGMIGNKVSRTLASIRASWKHHPDIFWATAPSFALAFSRGKTTILTVHDLRPFIDSQGDSPLVTTYRRLAFASAIKSADRIICVSQRTLQDLERIFPAAKSKSVAIPLSGERLGEHSTSKSVQSSRSVSVIAHEHNKRAHRVVPAIKFLRADIQVNFLCGKHIADWHEELDGVSNAHIIGFLPDEEYVQTIAQSSAVVMLSNFEGFGIPIVEAQRLGVPVVISDDPALTEVASPDALVVTSMNSPQEIARAILIAISSANQKLRPGQYDNRTWSEVTAETVRYFMSD
jgi:glycosyltransferase involved in cell wall biosynthesis